MNALCLSAGYGTRLGRLTKRTPKPLIEVDGTPVLEHIVDHLRYYGIANIVVNTHYLPLKIMEHFGTSILYTYEPKLLGEEGTILELVRNFPIFSQSYLLVANGDTLTNLNINEMFRMSSGRSIKHMQNGVYTGTKILSPEYLQGINKKVYPYYQSHVRWFDIGTPSGLKKARRNTYKTKAN